MFANAFFQQGKLEEAIQNYKKAFEINPKLEQAYFNLAIAFY
jgi:tetratricopeptide (TPR) repeat protein